MPNAHIPTTAITMMIPKFMELVYNKNSMIKILFLFLCAIPFFEPQVFADIEIIVNGHTYASMQAYLASKKVVRVPSTATAVTLNNQQEAEIKQEAGQLGVKIDLNKV